MSQEESSQPTRDGPQPDDQQTIAELTAKVAFLEKKLQIVGTVTRHDVLNQLTAIVGYTELLGMFVTEQKCRGFLEKENVAIGKIRRQFQFAKDYQNIAVDPPRWQNLRSLLNRVSEEFETRKVRISADTGPAFVRADPLLDRVFYHIFEFALRDGGVTAIRVFVQQAGPSTGILVESNGAGVPDAEKEKIFDRGYDKGNGWGLFLAREILAATGMTIAENGEAGTGKRFEITLPAASFRPDGFEDIGEDPVL